MPAAPLAVDSDTRRPSSCPRSYRERAVSAAPVQYPPIPYVIELKYLKPGAGEERAGAAAAEATAQLRRYLADRELRRQYPAVRFTGLSLVFRGAELVRSDAVPMPSEE